MAKRDTPAIAIATGEQFLVKLANYNWNCQLLLPAELASEFAALMSKIQVVEGGESLRQSSATVLYPEPDQQGALDYTIVRLGQSVLTADKEEAQDYAAFHNSTVELQGIDQYTRKPHVSLEEFREHAAAERLVTE